MSKPDENNFTLCTVQILPGKQKNCELSWKKTNFGAPKIALEAEHIPKTA